MKSTVVDEDGTVRCPVCGAVNSFMQKRTGKAKIIGVATVGVGAVAMPKRLKCNGCGTNLKRGDPPKMSGAARLKESRESLAATRISASEAKTFRLAMKAQQAADRASGASIGKGERRCVENGHLVKDGQVRCPLCLSAVRLVVPEAD
jgi:ribosomal protein S27E